jgi:ATP-dependent helicase HrpB
MGCFWGAERKFWQLPTASTRPRSATPAASRRTRPTRRSAPATGHNEVVLVVFDPKQISYEQLLKVFWENHDPTQGMRQGNDVGTQYRSGIYYVDDEQRARPRRRATRSRSSCSAAPGTARSRPRSSTAGRSTTPRTTTSSTSRRTRRLLRPRRHRRVVPDRPRTDLRIVVMSATLDVAAVAAFLDGCPAIDVPGRVYPLEVEHAPGQSVVDAAAGMLRDVDGQLLCFLPGASEIRRAVADLQPRVGAGVDVVPLHGSLTADEQDRALRPSAGRRIVVATNIAETSLTVPGVTAVIDTGLHKVARYDPERGIDSLELERITADAAEQRAGRAGRIAPGRVRRLWDPRDRLRPHREPEIHRVDLAATVLDVLAWGGDPRTLEWFEAPDAAALESALTLLARLGLVDGDRAGGPGGAGAARRAGTAGGPAPRLTSLGRAVRELPLHPRLARMLAAADGAREMARACALLSERHALPPRAATTRSDLLSALDRWSEMPPHVQRAADEISRRAGDLPIGRRAVNRLDETAFRRAVFAGYPDRVAQRRERGSPNVLLASGTGATIARESGVRDGEFLAALDVHEQPALPGRQPQGALIRIASGVEREWLEPTHTDVVHRFDKAAGRVRALAIDRYDALTLAERAIAPDPDVAAQLLADGWLARGPRGEEAQLIRRLAFAGHAVDLESLARTAACGVRSLDDVRLASALPPDVARALDRDAPESINVPSGRTVRLEYQTDGTVSASVKLQELFGLADTPTVGRRREPVLLSLLAPNGRPVQLTRDLRSFWNRTYPEVRKELRGRYPKHPWPDDPWSATPTHRTRRR